MNPSRITIMGLGRFGGGLGVTQHLAQHAAQHNTRITLTDLATHDQLAPQLQQLKPHIDAGTISLRLGEHREEDFINTDLVIANPAVPTPWSNPYLNAARGNNIPITTETRLGLELLAPHTLASPQPTNPSPLVIAVTGTAGKSTTAAMIHHALTALGITTQLAGNIGRSLLDPELLANPPRALVLELSSAQLHWLDKDAGAPDQPPFVPDIFVFTNLAPNHLDWHTTFEHYARAKASPLLNASALSRNTHAILGPNVADTLAEALNIPDDIDAFHNANDAADIDTRSPDACPPLAIPGSHNRTNAALAAHAVAAALDTLNNDAPPSLAPIFETLTTFPGLPHRLQRVAARHPISAFNDSKSTTPEATATALDALDDDGPGADRVILIAGGADKHIELAPLANAAARCNAVFTIGTTGPALAELAKRLGANAEHAATLEAATARAADRARQLAADGLATVILLSPGCASWDQFSSYEQRGDTFTTLISTHLGS